MVQGKTGKPVKKWWVAIAALVVLVSCKKEVSELPAPTETGAGTFGAKVNGAYWVPQGFGVVPTASILEVNYGPERSIILRARNFAASPTEKEFEIFLLNVTRPGDYLLNKATQAYPAQTANYAYYIERRLRPLNEWMTNAQYTGVVHITKADSVNRIGWRSATLNCNRGPL
jgi:hypothetical protein